MLALRIVRPLIHTSKFNLKIFDEIPSFQKAKIHPPPKKKMQVLDMFNVVTPQKKKAASLGIHQFVC